MIYLISQILLCLAFAVLLGGALGWLAHRARGAGRLRELRAALARQSRLLGEARGEVAMLNDDFDELRRRSRDEIDALREENRELPVLAGNLEKSQLMVRQTLQRHDTQVRELTNANAALTERLALLQAQADLRERAHAELESARLRETREARGAREGAEAAEPADASMDEVMELDADFAAELLDDEEDGEANDDARETAAGERADPAPAAPAAPATVPPDAARDPIRHAPGERVPDPPGATPPSAPPPAGELAAARAEEDALAEDDTVGEEYDEDYDDEANATLAIDAIDADLALAFDADEQDAPLFDPVDRQDDLQQLFGIGPVTEKALNALGITSYSQLAELESHEIEKIADALQIGPDRIERDDWVGNARRQLEEVLEEL